MWINLDSETATALLNLINGDSKDAVSEELHIRQFVEKIETATAELTDPIHVAFRNAAKEYRRDGDLEFDDGAVVSIGGDPGAYVMGWKWIENSEAGLPEDTSDLEEPE